MIKRYLTTARRTLLKNKLYSLINILGLSVSIASAIIIISWVWDEWSYDKMHTQGERIYSITSSFDSTGTDYWRKSPSALKFFATEDIPAIENLTRISEATSLLIEYNNKRFLESIYHIDPSFFNIFDFPFIEGSPNLPFSNTHSVVLSHTMAKKYFGDENPIGKSIVINKNKSYTVSAVIDDMPHNSSMQFDVMLPFTLQEETNLRNDWINFNYETYILLKEGQKPDSIAKQLTTLHKKHNPEALESLASFNYGLFPLFDNHLKGETKRDKQVWIFALIAFSILTIASINYVNLVNARASRRSKEVGIRKLIGASRTHLFFQFISESVIIFIISTIMAIGLCWLLIPFYSDISGKEMSFSILDTKIWIIIFSTIMTLLLMAGIYPAITLSKFQVRVALQGSPPSIRNNRSFRSILLLFQFVCSVILMISTFIIGRQLSFIRHTNLGYDKENVFTIPKNNIKNIDSFKTRLKQQPGISGVTISSSEALDNARSMTTSIDWQGKPKVMSNFMINQLAIDQDFTDVMNITFIDGKGFTGTAADSVNFLLNETAANQIKATVGMQMVHQGKVGTLVGIVKDFHFQDLKSKIGPLILFMDPDWGWDYIYIRTTAKEAQQAIASAEKLWKEQNAEYEFSFTFLDSAFNQQYKEDIRTGKIFNIFATIAILLSCLGLLGLVTYTAESKIKEIGIRRTLGASAIHIVLLISKDFLMLVGVALCVALPISWLLMNKWLDNYVYRTKAEWWVFALASIITFLIAIVTVSIQALRAAQANPVDSLRDE